MPIHDWTRVDAGLFHAFHHDWVTILVSPRNKASTNELRTFVEKTSNLIMHGIHLLVIDLFPPSKRDPAGVDRLASI